MPTTLEFKSYDEILRVYPLKVIKNEQDHEEALKILESLLELYEDNPHLTYIKDYIETLTILIHQYQEISRQMDQVSPIGVLKFLMNLHSITAQDLVDVFENSSTVSGILDETIELTVKHIKGLSKKFHVQPSVFF